MTSPTNFTILPNDQQGFVYQTSFRLSANIPANFISVIWDFGDSTSSYNSLTAEHRYQYPGIYTISLSALYSSGSIVTDNAEISVDYKYRDAIQIVSKPINYGTASLMPSESFVFSVTSAQINSPLVLMLQSINSDSLPHYAIDKNNKWSFLAPQWKFVDAATNETIQDGLFIKTNPIIENGITVAVSGIASFYYYDDSPSVLNSCPLLLVATLCAQNFYYPKESLHYPYYSYANSEVTRASIAWQINETIPTDLNVTENYINEVYPIKWSNIPIPILINCEYNSSSFGLSNSPLNKIKVLSYPSTNLLGAQNPIKLQLLSGTPIAGPVPDNLYTIEVDGVSYSPSAAPLYFKATDELGNPSRGYIFTTITPLVSFDGPITLSATTVAINGNGVFQFPRGYPIYPFVYISHPEAGCLNKIGITTYSKTDCGSVSYYQNLGTVSQGSLDLLKAPVSLVFDSSTYSLSGAAAVYGMAVNPMSNRLYAADADQSTILVYDGNSSSLFPISSVNLHTYTSEIDNVPSYISIDGNGNVWVSLFGNLSCLKFDPDFNFLTAALPSTSAPLNTTVDGNLLIEPPIVETDFNNDVWVCYAHPDNSKLVKFDSNGNELFNCPDLDIDSVPVSLAIDNSNNVWVACRETDKIECFSPAGAKIASLGNYLKPSYIMFDRLGSLWITHGIDRISKQNITNFTVSTTWKINSFAGTLSAIPNTYTTTEIETLNSSNEVWGGLTVDVFDNVWVIDSEQNKVFAFKSTDVTSTLSVFSILPTVNDVSFIASGTQTSYTATTNVRSAQAGGDWSGNRWYQKYAGTKGQSLLVRGSSTPFKVLDLENGIPNIVKVNEEFDTAKYYKSLALPEFLNKNTEFFDEFMKALVGDGNPFAESVGRIVYERIANFTSNHGNLDTVEIDQLISFAKSMSVESQTFATDFPREIERLLNLFSINKHYLRGQRKYDSSLENIVGDLITNTDFVTAGTTIIMKDLFHSTYQPIYISPLDTGDTVFPLLSIEIDGARTPIFDNYFFFQYNNEQIGYENNIINWESLYNTLEYSLSTDEEWYGDDQLVELSFNNLLTKRLFS